MSETAGYFFNLEAPSPGATLPQGSHVLRGWVWPKPGGLVVDVRARVGGRIFAGVHGFPRADLAAHFQTGRPVALAEFHVVVEFSPGHVELALEALTIEGRWSEFQRVSYTVVAAEAPTRVGVPDGPLRWIDYGDSLKQLLREVARQPDRSPADLARQLAGELPNPRVLRDAPAPLLGFVDEPATVCCCRFGRIPAFGHLFHPELRTRRILGTVDLQSWQPLQINQASPGPAGFYPQYANAQTCGFVGLVDVPAQLPNPVTLRIYAELEDGSLHLGPVVRTRLHSAEDEKRPIKLSPAVTFDDALQAWDEALAQRGIQVARDGELTRYVATLRASTPTRSDSAITSKIVSLRETPAKSAAHLPRRVLLASHGLSRQGAPRFLLEYARALAAAGVELQVVSAEDGPLRGDFAALGAKVMLVDPAPLLQAASDRAAEAALATLAGQAGWATADLVVANSFTTFWAVHAAKAAGRPVLMYVHESTTPAMFYGQRVSPVAVAVAEAAFAKADLVSFTTASTRSYHLGYGRPDRHRLTPGWVDLAAMDQWSGRQNREQLRRDLDVKPGEQLVCNIGTISDRKGQHTFARAVDLLWRRYPQLAARTKFILLGGRDSPFDRMLAETLADLGRENLVVHPETSDYLRYYLAAELVACSSYEESSPLVVLEAMACRAPLLASAVHGIPELVRPELEAVLLPAGDTVAWCEGLARMLAAPPIGRELAARARARAEEKFAAGRVLPRHLALAGEAAERVPTT